MSNNFQINEKTLSQIPALKVFGLGPEDSRCMIGLESGVLCYPIKRGSHEKRLQVKAL